MYRAGQRIWYTLVSSILYSPRMGVGFRTSVDPNAPKPKTTPLGYEPEDLETRLQYVRALRAKSGITPRQAAWDETYEQVPSQVLGASQDHTISQAILLPAFSSSGAGMISHHPVKKETLRK